jgi:hypothetical protein
MVPIAKDALCLLLYCSVYWLCHFMYGSLAFWCPGNNLGQTLRVKIQQLMNPARYDDKTKTHELLKHTLVQRTFWLATRVVFLQGATWF